MDKNSGGAVTKTTVYYPAAGAMRINGTLYYTLKDHLGSASVVTESTGAVLGEQRYYPFGETRLATGSMFTDRLFTGQRAMAGLGIYHYGARFYSPKLGRFLSPDTIVPSFANPQNLNRFGYVINNPVRYTDPTGHVCTDPDDPTPSCEGGGPPPPNTPAPLGDAPVVYPPDPLDPGQEEDDPTPAPNIPLPAGDSCSGSSCPIVSNFPDGPSCSLVNPYCSYYSELPEPYPWLPDYFALGAGAPVLWILGIDAVFTFDKYGRIYFGAGPSAGTSYVGLDVNVSASFGYIIDSNTTADEAHSFISEWSGGGCAGFGPGLCVVTGDPFGGDLDNPNNWAVQVGGFTPQVGVAFPYSWQIYP